MAAQGGFGSGSVPGGYEALVGYEQDSAAPQFAGAFAEARQGTGAEDEPGSGVEVKWRSRHAGRTDLRCGRVVQPGIAGNRGGRKNLSHFLRQLGL
jgi:hypothetical protein